MDKGIEKDLGFLDYKKNKNEVEDVPKGCEGTCGNDLVSLYEERIVGEDMLQILTNGIPNHDYMHKDHLKKDVKNTKVCEHKSSILISRNPRKIEIADDFIDTPSGTIGILKTGAFLFNHLTEEGKIVAMTEKHSLDHCHGRASQHCQYHYLEISQNHACSFDKSWDQCEHIGYMLDGSKYSHCRNDNNADYLKSCYKLRTNHQNINDPDEYVFDRRAYVTGECHLNEANAFNFGKGFVDSKNNTIEGWAYVASETYPFVMPKFMGIPTVVQTFKRKISINTNTECLPKEGRMDHAMVKTAHLCTSPKAPGCKKDVCYSKSTCNI